MDQYQIGSSTGVCAATGRDLAEGEDYYAVLFEDGDSFRRADYALDAWQGPPQGAYCHFRTRIPVRQEKKKRVFVDDDVLVGFFLRLADETEPARLQFRFVLALILMRKRILRYEATHREDEAEYWEMRFAGRHGVSAGDARGLHRVLNPHLSDEQIAGVADQLGAILHGEPAPGEDRPTEQHGSAAGDGGETTGEAHHG